MLSHDSFCASESDVVRSVMDWFAFNNRTDIETKHFGVFQCIRLTLTRLLISRRQLPAAHSLVIDAKEAKEYATQAQQRQTSIRFELGTVRVSSAAHGCQLRRASLDSASRQSGTGQLCQDAR